MNFHKTILKGVSQVFLQNNAITGLLFLIGIFYNSWLLGLGALFGNLISTLGAYFFNYDKDDISNGLYGFNGTLVGIALLVFFNPTIFLFSLIFLGSLLSTIVMRFMKEKNLNPYTFPFVFATWIFILIAKFISIPEVIQPNATSSLNIISSLSMGIGQVMFQASIVTGILFLIAIFINSKRAAFLALFGSLLGASVALLFSFPINLIKIGIFGYNGVLCAIAFNKKLFNATIAVILSVFVLIGMINLNLIALTAPFVFATWITSAIKH